MRLRPFKGWQHLTTFKPKTGKTTVHQYFSSRTNDVNNFDWQLESSVEEETNVPTFKVDLPVRQCHSTRSSFLSKAHNQIKFKSTLRRKNAVYATTLGPVSFDAPWCADPHDQKDLECGYRKRIIPEMPVVDQSILGDFRMFVSSYLAKHLVPLPHLSDKDRDTLFESWVSKQQSYSKTRKSQLRTAYLSVKDKPLEEKDYYVKSFIKREFYEEPKFPRFINSRSDRFKARVAACIHLIEDQVYHLPQFVKHKPITSLPKDLANLSKYSYILETDYSSFESGFNPFYVDSCECQLWRYMLQNNPDLLEDVLKCYYQVVEGVMIPRIERLYNDEFEARVQGSRMSGDMWTSLGNGFSNLMNVSYFANKRNENFDGFVEGDDGIFGMDHPFMNKADYESLGFKIKMEYVHDLNETCFCGNLFDLKDQKTVISPEQIARVFWTCNAQYLTGPDRFRTGLLRSKAMSLNVTGKFTPIAGPLSEKICSILGSGLVVSHDKWKFENILKYFDWNDVKSSVPISSRLLYQSKFGITVEEQIMLERLINNANSISDLYLPMRFLNWSNCCNMI